MVKVAVTICDNESTFFFYFLDTEIEYVITKSRLNSYSKYYENLTIFNENLTKESWYIGEYERFKIYTKNYKCYSIKIKESLSDLLKSNDSLTRTIAAEIMIKYYEEDCKW